MSDPLKNDPARLEPLILVDGLDRPLGTASKEEVHRRGLLHRAFSVLLLRESEEGPRLLLCRRAEDKYHSGGLWANSCCSHPRAGEALEDAVPRRLREELGCGAGDLREIGAFVYRAAFPTGLWEYEYDHVFLGTLCGEPAPDPAEIGGTRWVSPDALAGLLAEQSGLFAPWAFTVLSMALRELTAERR